MKGTKINNVVTTEGKPLYITNDDEEDKIINDINENYQDGLIKLARMVAGRIGYDFENQLLYYPQYETDRRNILQSQSKNPPAPIKVEGIELRGIPQVILSPTQRNEYYRGIGSRTAVPLGRVCLPTALLESNARHSAAQVARMTKENVTLLDLINTNSQDVYDTFVELVATNIRIVNMNARDKTYARKLLSDNAMSINDILTIFSKLKKDNVGELYFSEEDFYEKDFHKNAVYRGFMDGYYGYL